MKSISMASMVALTTIFLFVVCMGATPRVEGAPVEIEDITSIRINMSPRDVSFPIMESERGWRAIIGDRFAYSVLREQGTERAYSGSLLDEARKGIYHSRATGQPLFSSEHKYESGTGWPSFWRPISRDSIVYHADRGFFGTRRVEVADSSSGSHIGHVFEDGPRPTGLRYCLNSAAMIFVPEGARPPKIVRDYEARQGGTTL